MDATLESENMLLSHREKVELDPILPSIFSLKNDAGSDSKTCIVNKEQKWGMDEKIVSSYNFYFTWVQALTFFQDRQNLKTLSQHQSYKFVLASQTRFGDYN